MTFKSDLEQEVRAIFAEEWKERVGKAVPGPKDLSLKNDALKLQATVLYADIDASTDLVDRYRCEPSFAAEVYKTYLRCAATIINSEQGNITAYDGDRIMAVFLGESNNISAVRTALKINYVVDEIINPSMKKAYPNRKYQLKHVVGIDTSELFAAKIGVRKDNDLVWVGRAANYAAKLCSLNDGYSIYITKAVFDALDTNTKYGGKDNKEPMWEDSNWPARNNMRIYGSTWQWEIE